MVVYRLRLEIADVGVDEALDGNRIARHDAGVLQQLLRLFVETLSSGDDGVGNGKKDDLDEFDADNLALLVNIPHRCVDILHHSRWHSAGQQLCRRVVQGK